MNRIELEVDVQIASVGHALGAHAYGQDELVGALRALWARRHFNLERLERLHRNVQVGRRHLALPLEEYPQLTRWGQANDAWIRIGLDLGEQATRAALERADVPAEELGAFFFTTVTGVATPSLDARLVNRLRLPQRIKRMPLFGLGCLAGAAGVARAADYLRAYPDEAALLLSVELCSLTLQRDDLSIPNLISSGLFGDGAAAVVLLGEGLAARRAASAAKPRVVASRSAFFYDTERVMGWDISEKGFQIVLSADVPRVVLERLAPLVDGFLAEHGLGRGDVARWVCHPGGPRVLEAMQETLDLGDEALAASWRSLHSVGNLSSSSVLLVLEECLGEGRPAPGSWGLMIAMGPGFCAEVVLLRW